MNGTKPRICFVAHNAYGALAGGNSGHIGGWWAADVVDGQMAGPAGYHVSMITWDEGQADVIEIDGVRVFKLCRQDVGIPGLRFFWPRWTSLNAAMKRADADVYYQNNAEAITGHVAMWCRRHGRRFIYSVASDTECETSLPRMHSRRERALYRYGLKHADSVIVQTHKQQQMLREGFGCDSTILPMPCPGPSETEYAACEQNRNGSLRVLWIGRVCEVKRPDRLLELARSCPDVHFDMVGPAGDSEYARNICERARTLKNVTVHGPASRDRVAEFYRRAKLLCCTSDFEGFPNTFLEAWSYGVPIVSTVDPDGLIAERGLGRVVEDTSDLIGGTCEMLRSPEQWARASKAARAYYMEHHTTEKAMVGFEQVFVALPPGAVVQ